MTVHAALQETSWSRSTTARLGRAMGMARRALVAGGSERGWVLAMQGEAARGVAQIRQGLAAPQGGGLNWLSLLFTLDTSTEGIGTYPPARPLRGASAQADDAQLGAHTQHCPLLTLHEPADDVTSQGADTLVSKLEALQSQVSPHTATVFAAAHTQHSPLPT